MEMDCAFSLSRCERPCAADKRRERWGLAPRYRLTGAGSKPP